MRSELLTDLGGLEEDGDMTLTVAGTRNGITAVQLDVARTDVTVETLTAALHQARTARLQMLGVMEAALPAERGDQVRREARRRACRRAAVMRHV